MQVFVSVGTGLNPEQEAFVSAVEAGLRARGLEPCAIGRNKFSPDAPLKAIIDLMGQCSGAVVLAVERYRFDGGIERPVRTSKRRFVRLAYRLRGIRSKPPLLMTGACRFL